MAQLVARLTPFQKVKCSNLFKVNQDHDAEKFTMLRNCLEHFRYQFEKTFLNLVVVAILVDGIPMWSSG